MHVSRQPVELEFQGHRSKVKVTCFLGVFFLCAICYGYPRTVLSLEQGLILFSIHVISFRVVVHVVSLWLQLCLCVTVTS